MSQLPPAAGLAAQDPPDATLVFHEQADGRKIARLPGGKVVLVDLGQLDRVRDGEAWFVRLRHRDSFAIAEPVERVTRAALDASGGPLTDSLARALRDARARIAPPAVTPAPPATPADPSMSPEPAAAPATPLAPAVSRRESPPHAGSVLLEVSRLLRPSDRVALFIDGANTDGAARAAGYFIDFRRTREFFVANASFYAAFYYVADFTASDPLQQRFFDFLSHAGYIVRRRPVKVIDDPDTGERIIKGNVDTEIVLDLLNTVDNYDVAFLFSGDSDFERAVELLRSRGKRVFVVSARGPLSRELAYVADKPIVYLEEIRHAIARGERATAVQRPAADDSSGR